MRERLVPNEARIADEDAIPAKIIAEMRSLGLFQVPAHRSQHRIGETTRRHVILIIALRMKADVVADQVVFDRPVICQHGFRSIPSPVLGA